MGVNSTVTIQSLVDNAQLFGDISAVFNVAGFQSEPALTIANDVNSEIIALPFPQKWNEIILPQFYTNSGQQDYAGIYPDGTPLTNLNWLERGIVIDINNSAQPKPYRPVDVGRQLPQATGGYFNQGTAAPLFRVNWFPNQSLYYGVWGEANTGSSTFGNNPVSGSVYTNPLGQGAMPANPIQQIIDANDNLLVLTGFGTEGSTAPVAPADSAPGTIATPGSGATTEWTVVAPDGQGFRILPVPSTTGTVWQFNLVGQANPVLFTTLSQTLAPLPDIYASTFRQGFIAQCYRYSPEAKIRAKFPQEWQMWKASLVSLKAEQDREPEQHKFVCERGVVANVSASWYGPAYPFNSPGRY